MNARAGMRLSRFFPVTGRKILRDLSFSATRTVMLIVALSAGVFALSTMLSAMTALRREMGRNYNGTRPASATLRAGGFISDAAEARVAALEGIETTELRRVVRSRMWVDGQSYPILLFVIRDFRNIRLNRILHVSGSAQPARGEMLIERTSERVMRAGTGANIVVRTPRGRPQPLTISGIVHDPGLAPAWQEQCGYGYITMETLELLGEKAGWDELRIQTNNAQTAMTASAAADILSANGTSVHAIQIPPPRRHPHQSQMEAVLALFLVFALLTLALSAILTTATITTVMVRQTREIGILKSFGAETSQIAGMYLLMILMLATAALFIAIPLGRAASSVLVERIAVLLNLEIQSDAPAPWVYAAAIAAAYLFPLLAAAWPVWRASRISVRAALDYRGNLAQVSTASRRLPMALRNILRNPGRLFLSTALLTAGGGLFMSTLNIRAAWGEKLGDINRSRLYDLELRLAAESVPVSFLTKLKEDSTVDSAEVWSISPAGFYNGSRYLIENTYPDQGHGSLSIVTAPRGTDMVHIPMLEGKWFDLARPPGQAFPDAVLNHIARDRARMMGIDTSPGSIIRVQHDDRITPMRIIGLAEDIGSQATVYTASDAFQRQEWEGQPMLRIRLKEAAKQTETRAAQEIENLVDSEMFPVDMLFLRSTLKNAVGEHMTVLLSTLMAASVLMALVGFLGLISTMTMTIVERTREIGVMRAMGSRSSYIRNLLISEGLWTAAVSLLPAWLLSLLVSWLVGGLIGTMAFRTPLSLVSVPAGWALWTLILLSGTILAATIPVRRALAASTRSALSYEG